jgi:predicted dienelactone hydrolase
VPPGVDAGAVLDPGLPGPWPVGYGTVRVADPRRPGRVLVTSVWYPARPSSTSTAGLGARELPRTISLRRSPPAPRKVPAAALVDAGVGDGGACPEMTVGGPRGAAGQPAFYPLVGKIGLTSASAVTDAEPAPGPFALVVFSHGSAGSRVQASYLMEALASHGYVVVAPDHPGDTMMDVADGHTEAPVDMAIDRSRDVSAVLDALTAPTCTVAPLVRPDQIAVVGFSFGGLTSVLASEGLASSGHVWVPADPRVRASVGLAPAISPLPPELLAGVAVPTLLIGAGADPAVPVDANVDRPFGLLTASHPVITAVLGGATHNSFSEVCRQYGLLNDRGIPARLRLRVAVTAAATCWPPYLDPGTAHLLTTRTVVAFLDWQLRGQSGYRTLLAPGVRGSGPTMTLRARP